MPRRVFEPDCILQIDPAKGPEKLAAFIKAAQAVARVAYYSIYIIDYQRRAFAYVADNPIFLCGLTASRVMALGPAFYMQQVPPDDLEIMREMHLARTRFFENIAPENRLRHSISYDFRLRQANDNLLLVNHRLTPLELDDAGNIWLSMCLVSISSRKKSGNVIIREHQSDVVYKYLRKEARWSKTRVPQLTAREKEILYRSAQGYSVPEIGRQLFLSEDTIKYCRKKIYKNLGAKNISEAISEAVNYNLV